MNSVVLKGKLGAGFNDDRYTLPKNGNPGDILVKTETGSEWKKQEPATSTPDWHQNDSTASDYIKNRPGGYTVNHPALDIEWDGVIGDRVSVDVNGAKFVKVSDEIPKSEQLVGGSFTLKDGNASNTVNIADEYIQDFGNGIYGLDLFLVVNKAPANFVHPSTGEVLAVFPETGIYFVWDSEGNNIKYTSSLFMPAKSVIVPIPQEYVEGLEATTANANQALEKATAAQNTANTAKSTAEVAKTAADDALTKKNGGISEGVIGGSLIKAYESETWHADLGTNGLNFFNGSSTKMRTSIGSDGYSVFGDTDADYIQINPNSGSSSMPYITVSRKNYSMTIRADGEISANNPEKTLKLLADAVVIDHYTSNRPKKIKITIGDDARPTFTDTSNPNNTWTPGDNLPTVTASDKGKFLRVSTTGEWVAEEGMIINSSTPNSTKKFKITVDDTGTISATEVT